MKRTTTGFSLPADILNWLKNKALSEDRSVSGMLSVVLRKVMDEEKE